MATDADQIIKDEPVADASIAEAAPAPDEVSATDLYADDQAPADAPAEGEEGAEGQEPAEELEPIAPPTSWAKDYKDQFAALPREMQQIISARETERDKFVNQKSMEAANTRKAVETEARNAFVTLQRNHAEQLQSYAQQFEAPEPDPRLLYTGNPEHQALYMQQQQRYQATIAQRQQAQQEADTARQRADAIEQQSQAEHLQEQHRILAEQVPEWSEPSSRAKLLSDLQPIASELGYSDEVMAQANASDILALRHIAGLKADAMKYRELMKKKMIPVRQAKTLPPVTRAGAPNAGTSQPIDAAALLYPDDQPRR